MASGRSVVVRALSRAVRSTASVSIAPLRTSVASDMLTVIAAQEIMTCALRAGAVIEITSRPATTELENCSLWLPSSIAMPPVSIR
ncbi:MAG: hypothetical protein ACYDHH_08690 [Solirubrobacteraceae bacterium]